jgi:PIN domain nuclease of toxin-antitoxin system
VRILLDTHMVIWWLDDDPALPEATRAALADPRDEVLVSSISLAEISIKSSLGKLRAPWIPDALLEENGLSVLPFSTDHARRLVDLPHHHRDPFDRMLVAQALHDDLVFASVDPQVRAYDIRILGRA